MVIFSSSPGVLIKDESNSFATVLLFIIYFFLVLFWSDMCSYQGKKKTQKLNESVLRILYIMYEFTLRILCDNKLQWSDALNRLVLGLFHHVKNKREWFAEFQPKREADGRI